jgi:hypothetical protein
MVLYLTTLVQRNLEWIKQIFAMYTKFALGTSGYHITSYEEIYI